MLKLSQELEKKVECFFFFFFAAAMLVYYKPAADTRFSLLLPPPAEFGITHILTGCSVDAPRGGST